MQMSCNMILEMSLYTFANRCQCERSLILAAYSELANINHVFVAQMVFMFHI